MIRTVRCPGFHNGGELAATLHGTRRLRHRAAAQRRRAVRLANACVPICAVPRRAGGRSSTTPTVCGTSSVSRNRYGLRPAWPWAGSSGDCAGDRIGQAGGALIGAAGGAAIGAIAGNAGLGAGVGAVAGLAGGLIYIKEDRAAAYNRGYSAGQRDQPANPPR